MKRGIVLSLVVALALMMAAPVMAQENLVDWEEYIDPGAGFFSSEVSGTSVALNANGTGGQAWGALYKTFENALGMIANVSISEIQGEAQIGIRKYVSTLPNGNRVLAQIGVGQGESGQKAIYYSVRERDDSGATVKEFANGVLGGWSGTWKEGQNVLLAFAIIGNDIWFLSSVTEVIVKVQPYSSMNFLSDSPCYIWAFAQSGGGNDITGTVNNVTILQP